MMETRDISVPAMAGRLRHDTVTAERFEAWVRDAQPGARLLYGVGDYAAGAAGDGVASHARSYAERGLLRLEAVRRPKADAPRGYGFDYFAKRLDGHFPAERSPAVQSALEGYASARGRRLGR